MKHRPRPLAGVATLAALGAIATIPAPAAAKFGDETLSRGDSGRDVRVLQRWLGYVGFETDVDGHFGRGTVSALRGYERKFGKAVDGRLSPDEAPDLRRRAKVAFEQRNGESEDPTPDASGPVERATLSNDGRTAIAPDSAPQEVKDAIAAANAITDKPYKYGGGHASFEDSGYDCSGAASVVLHGAGKLDSPLDSSGLMSYGKSGEGKWITVYAHSSHAYVVIAGIRFDTSGSGEKGPRWRPEERSGSGYTVRHPEGL